MTTYTIYRNVEEQHSLSTDEYVPNITPIVIFELTSGFTISSVHMTIKPSFLIDSTIGISMTPTVTPTGTPAFDDITSLKTNVTGMAHTGAGKVVTLQAPNGFVIGETVVVAGVNSAFTVTNIDGSWVTQTGTDENQVVFTVTSEPVGTTPQTLNGGTIVGSGDCYILDPLTFLNNSTTFSIGNYTVTSGEWDNSYPYKVWIPFVVDVAKDTAIRLATISIVGAVDGNTDGGLLSFMVGCENTDDAIAPASFDDLNLRPLTDGYVESVLNDVSDWSAGTTYTYDITDAVQTILNDDDWVSGNTLAVMFMDYGSDIDVNVSFASLEHAVYTAPTLVIIE